MSLDTYSSWEDFEYRLVLSTCPNDSNDTSTPDLSTTPTLGDEGNFFDETILIPNPNPHCTVSGQVHITDVSPSPNGFKIVQTVKESLSYSCSAVNLTSYISNDDFYNSSIPV